MQLNSEQSAFCQQRQRWMWWGWSGVRPVAAPGLEGHPDGAGLGVWFVQSRHPLCWGCRFSAGGQGPVCSAQPLGGPGCRRVRRLSCCWYLPEQKAGRAVGRALTGVHVMGWEKMPCLAEGRKVSPTLASGENGPLWWAEATKPRYGGSPLTRANSRGAFEVTGSRGLLRACPGCAEWERWLASESSGMGQASGSREGSWGEEVVRETRAHQISRKYRDHFIGQSFLSGK